MRPLTSRDMNVNHMKVSDEIGLTFKINKICNKNADTERFRLMLLKVTWVVIQLPIVKKMEHWYFKYCKTGRCELGLINRTI